MKSGRPILVEISAGELVDKITILEIKSERIGDPAKLHNVRQELEVLRRTFETLLPLPDGFHAVAVELKRINESLWDIEDEIRDCERRQDFGARFVELARAVYRTNDLRAAVKRQVNDLAGSRLVEEKSYAEY